MTQLVAEGLVPEAVDGPAADVLRNRALSLFVQRLMEANRNGTLAEISCFCPHLKHAGRQPSCPTSVSDLTH